MSRSLFRCCWPGLVLQAGLLLLPATVAAQEYPKQPPPPGPLTPAPFPPFQETTLPNGLRLLVVENRRQPVVSMSLSFAAGSVRDPAGKEGLAAMVAGLLTKGAGDRTAEQIAEAIENVGGSLDASAGADFLTVTAGVLTPHVGLAFDLVADIVLRPRFPESEIELLRMQTLSGLQVELSQPDAVAARSLRATLYGTHPYGRSPTEASIQAITRQDIVDFHAAHLKPSGALLVLAGDISLDEARRQAVRALRGWMGVPTPLPPAPSPPTRTETELILVHRPGSVQSNLVVGNLAFEPADPRRYAATVANKVLGGGADSRLFLILREQKSWTYGAGSSFSLRRGVGFFSASAEVRTEVTDSALSELLAQLRSIGSEPISEAEFEAAKGALVGNYPLTIETAQQVASAVATARLYGLPADFVQTYRLRLGQVTPAEATAAARAFIRPDAAAVIVVGDGQKIYPRLREIAPVRIVTPGGRSLAPEDLVPRVAALPLDLSRLVPRRDSFAIMIQGNQLGALADTLERVGERFHYREATRIPGLVEQSLELELTGSLAPLSVRQTGRIQGQETRIDVRFSNGRARGTAVTPGPTGELRTVQIDTTIAPDALEENLVQVVLPALPWTPGAQFTFAVFESSSGEIRPTTLSVRGVEAVAVPAGSDDCYVVEMTGGPQAVVFYLTRSVPHRLMKIRLEGTPVEMVRVP